jgi:hypothetical protein
MQQFERRGLDPALIHRSIQRVKGVGILVAMAMLSIGCKESRESEAAEGTAASPLKKVDEIIANVEGAKALEKPADPPATEGNGEEEAPAIPVAEAVPDKPGFVISPYNGKWIDVTGVKAGTVVADPHFTEEKKFFRVPEIVMPVETEPESPGEEAAGDETTEDESPEEAAESE